MEKETSWFCLIFQSEDLLLRHLYFLHIIIIIIILRGISSAHDKFSIKSNTFKNKNNWLLSYSCNKSLCFYQKEARFLLSAPCTFCLVVTLKRISLPVSLYDVLYGKTVGISLLWHTHTFPGLFIVVGDMIWITRVKNSLYEIVPIPELKGHLFLTISQALDVILQFYCFFQFCQAWKRYIFNLKCMTVMFWYSALLFYDLQKLLKFGLKIGVVLNTNIWVNKPGNVCVTTMIFQLFFF